MRRYITSARGHELSRRVLAQAYNYAWAECAWLQSTCKLIITPPRLVSEAIILLYILQVSLWCSLKSVTTTLGLLFRNSWLHILHCTVVITLGNLASFPSYSCLVYMTRTKNFFLNEQKVGMLLQKRTDTRGVGISSMMKSLYLLTTTPSSHTHRFHSLPLATPTSCSPHPLATPIHSTHSPQLSSIL